MKRIFTKCLLLILVVSVWACDRQATQEVVVYTSVNGEIKLDGREKEIKELLALNVSKASIAKITGVDRATPYNFIGSRNLTI